MHLSIAASEDFDVRVKKVSKGMAVDVVREKTPGIVQESVTATRASAAEYPIR